MVGSEQDNSRHINFKLNHQQSASQNDWFRTRSAPLVLHHEALLSWWWRELENKMVCQRENLCAIESKKVWQRENLCAVVRQRLYFSILGPSATRAFSIDSAMLLPSLRQIITMRFFDRKFGKKEISIAPLLLIRQ